jgi:hypothetical protein
MLWLPVFLAGVVCVETIDDDGVTEICPNDIVDASIDLDDFALDVVSTVPAWTCIVAQRPFLPVAGIALQTTGIDVTVTLTLRFAVDATSVRCTPQDRRPLARMPHACAHGLVTDVVACLLDVEEHRALEAL